MSYVYQENIATADAAIEAEADTIEELFISFALGMEKIMVNNLEDIKPKIKKNIKLESDNLENLLFDFLDELLFYKDSEMIVFNKFELLIKNNKLKGVILGEKINKSSHKIGVDVKAITKHLFYIEKKEKKWTGRVIVDI